MSFSDPQPLKQDPNAPMFKLTELKKYSKPTKSSHTLEIIKEMEDTPFSLPKVRIESGFMSLE